MIIQSASFNSHQVSIQFIGGFAFIDLLFHQVSIQFIDGFAFIDLLFGIL